jgi:hypothetical protein
MLKMGLGVPDLSHTFTNGAPSHSHLTLNQSRRVPPERIAHMVWVGGSLSARNSWRWCVPDMQEHSSITGSCEPIQAHLNNV